MISPFSRLKNRERRPHHQSKLIFYWKLFFFLEFLSKSVITTLRYLPDTWDTRQAHDKSCRVASFHMCGHGFEVCSCVSWGFVKPRIWNKMVRHTSSSSNFFIYIQPKCTSQCIPLHSRPQPREPNESFSPSCWSLFLRKWPCLLPCLFLLRI